jgi:drug/metabolite transporter (DMT)-like permease
MEINIFIIALFISFAYALQQILYKNLLTNLNGTTILILCAFIYIFCILILLTYNYETFINDCYNINKNDIILILIVTVFTVFLNNIAYVHFIENANTTFVSGVINSSPFFTLLLAYLFMNETINIYGLFGIIFIISGVILVSNN